MFLGIRIFTAVARVLSEPALTRPDLEALGMIALFSCTGLFLSILLAMCGLDLSFFPG